MMAKSSIFVGLPYAMARAQPTTASGFGPESPVDPSCRDPGLSGHVRPVAASALEHAFARDEPSDCSAIGKERTSDSETFEPACNSIMPPAVEESKPRQNQSTDSMFKGSARS
jgi:hypothetical protein